MKSQSQVLEKDLQRNDVHSFQLRYKWEPFLTMYQIKQLKAKIKSILMAVVKKRVFIKVNTFDIDVVRC